MFEPAKHVNGKESGYKLVIVYVKSMDDYQLTGYQQTMGNNGVIHSGQDGGTLHFDNMADLINSLVNYEDK